MSIEPIIAFFLIRHLIKNLKTFNPLSKWIRIFKIAIYGVILLFIAGIIWTHSLLLWVGHLILLIIAGLVLKQQEFSKARTVIFAVLPFIILSLAGDIFESFAHRLYNNIEDYLDIANIFAIIWMVAMLIISNKQNKALDKERRKTQAEEEQNKWITARKAELEMEIIERTAEITQQKEELQKALIDLKSTQTQLIQQEKLASLGELTAGIAHEIQNPLNFVNNFSEISTELVAELKGILEKLSDPGKKYTDEILLDLTQNLEKITHHGKRADSIVKGMLQHSRSSSGVKEPTDINALADEYLRLSYHGLRARDKTFNALMQNDFDNSIQKINIVSQDIGRVLLNLFTNAFYAVAEKKTRTFDGGIKNALNEYQPTVKVTTRALKYPSGGMGVLISVKDNGNGIPQKVLDKIFQPFFTTKPTGQGTGLGLSLSYDIIKAHGGEINVETNEGKGTEFIIQLPVV